MFFVRNKAHRDVQTTFVFLALNGETSDLVKRESLLLMLWSLEHQRSPDFLFNAKHSGIL